MPTLHLIENLAEEFLGIARKKLTGTLIVQAEDDRKKQFFFQQGSLADIDTGRPDTLLEAALRDSGALGEKDIKRARKSMAGAEKTLGAALLDLGIVPETDVVENIRGRLTEEVCEVFDWPLATVEFFEHQADERLETFYSELTEYYEALADAEEVFLEAARRLERWDLVQKHFGVLLDVFYATPSSFRYFREQAKYPDEYAIVSAVDGIKDADELISQSGLDPFVAVNLLRKLRASGELELINPVQMFQLGVEFSGSGNFEKASKLFRRAMERGLDDFDILYKLAQALDSSDKVEEAVARYTEFGDKCASMNRLDDAARSLKRAIELDRGSVPAHEKYLEVLLQQKRYPESAEEAMALADLKVVHKDQPGALETLLRVREGNPQSSQLQQKIIALAESTRNYELARKERDDLARKTEQRKDAESEIERYQRRFCEGDDSLPVRIKLAELHLAKGNRPKALEHINSILNLPEKYKVKDESTLLLLHEAVREMKPADLRSNRWLADHHGRKGDKAKAVAVLQAWIASLEREGDTEEVVHAYERLLAIDDSSDHRWGLAMALEKINRLNESRRELRSLANLALRKKDFDQATRALDHILKAAPLDLETRKMQADLLEARENRISARKRHEEIAFLAMLAGNVQDAEQYCRRLPADGAETAEIVRKLGNLCHEQGDQQKAVEQIRKAVKLHLEHKNFGLAKLAIQDLLTIDPSNPDGAALLTDLKTRETPAPAAAAGGGPAAGPMSKSDASPGPGSAPGPAPAASAPPVPATAHAAAHPKPGSFVAPRSAVAAQAAQTAALSEDSAAEDKASPHLRFEREPFQPAAPVVTRVSGITAKLKKLKTAPTESRQPRSVQVQVKDITSKLRNMKDGESGASAAGGAQDGGAPLSGATAPAALKTAASRLKALAGQKAEEVSVSEDPALASADTEAQATAGMPDAATSAPEAPVAATQPKKLLGAAAKLAGLRKADGGPAPLQTKRPGSVVIKIPPGASGGGRAPGSAAPLSEDQAARIASGAAAGEVRKAKLNTSASKLAELRKKKAETA